MRTTVKNILFFSRPWEVVFHLKIAKRLAAEFPSASIKFATFFLKTKEVCDQSSIDCYYLPDLIDECDGTYDQKLLEEIDAEILQGFDTNLNALLNGERFLPEHQDDVQVFLMKHVRVISALVTPHTLSISGMFDHFVYCLAGALVNSRSGFHMAFVGCGVPGGRVLPLKSPSSTWPRHESNHFPVDIDLLIDEVRDKKASQRIEYMQELDDSFEDKSRNFTLPFLVSRYFKRRRYMDHDYKHGSYFATKNPLLISSFFEKLTNLLPESKQGKYYDIDDMGAVQSQQGIYVALHQEPESTLLMYSPWFNNQLEYIRLLSVCLPPGIFIYVKENPKMIGVRNTDYYRELKRIPNVFIVNHEIESSALIENTILTASIAGTVIAEAFLLNRPAICIGKPPVRNLASFTLFDHSISELREYLKKVCQGQGQEHLSAEEQRSRFEEWVNQSFPALCVPVFGDDGELHTPSSDENIERYISVILSICENNGA